MAVSFNDLHDVMVQKKDGLLTSQQFHSWLDEHLEVLPYIPFVKKYAIVKIFSENIKSGMGKDEDYNVDAIHLYYNLNQIFSLLFAYTDVAVSAKDRTDKNYDLIMESGFYDYMEIYCGKDYDRLVKICDDVTGINNICIMEQIVNAIGKQPTVAEMKAMANIINNEIDKDKLELIKTINEYNDPMTKKVVDAISKQSAKEVMTKVHENKDK